METERWLEANIQLRATQHMVKVPIAHAHAVSGTGLGYGAIK